MTIQYTAGKTEQKKTAAITAWDILKNKTAFDALTAAQKAELLRLALVYLLKDKLQNDAPE